MLRLTSFLCVSLLMASSEVFASAGAEIINYYSIFLRQMGLADEHAVTEYTTLVGGLVSLGVIVVCGYAFRSKINQLGDEAILPPEKIGLRAFFESILEGVYGLAENIIGKAHAADFLPLLCGLFLFIFVSNLSGLVPGFPPATESLSGNLAMGLSVFAIYNYFGFKRNGLDYAKHFLGPVWWLAPLFLLIEVVSHLARPVSLSLRLYGNIFGDHLVMSVVVGLTYIGGILCLLFGSLVATLQSLVFTLLTSIYISMAISHEDH